MRCGLENWPERVVAKTKTQRGNDGGKWITHAFSTGGEMREEGGEGGGRTVATVVSAGIRMVGTQSNGRKKSRGKIGCGKARVATATIDQS